MLNLDDCEQIERLASQLRKRWAVGDDGLIDDNQLPAAWRELFAQDAAASGGEQRRLALLALLGQYQLLMYRPKAPELQRKRDLPQLALPALPDALRAPFRRILEQQGKIAAPGRLLQLVARRGYSAHPADWLPEPAANSGDIPDLYTPWLHWMMQREAEQPLQLALDEDSWPEFAPAERLALLAEVRRRDPAAARALLQACAAAEPAEQRVRLLEKLEINLGADDVEYLRSLSGDRSQKVKDLVLQLLSRQDAVDAATAAALGAAAKEGDETDRLVEGFRVKKVGLLKRSLTVVPEKLKRGKQTALRLQQLSAVTFPRFAEVLEITPAELAAGWRFADAPLQENSAFMACAVASATDADLALLLDNLLADCDADQCAQLLSTLRERLSRAQVLAVFERLQQKKGMELDDWENFLRIADVELSWDVLHKSRACRDFLAALRREVSGESYLDDNELQRQIDALALLLDRRGAETALDTLTQLGVLRVDPALELLKFNTSLTGSGASGLPE